MKKLSIILFLIVLVGCTSQKTILNSWIGLTKHDLILSWGPPVRTADDGNGGEVLIYAHQVDVPDWHLNYWDYKMIYTDSDGKIYHWRTERQSVAPTDVVVTFRQ